MWRQVLRWFAPLFLIGTCSMPAAYAQRYAPPPEPETTRTPALPYTFAFASTLLVLVITCTPSRKN